MKKILCTIVLALSILLIFTINFKVNASGLRLDLGNNINSINNNENYKWDETTPPKTTDPWDTYLDRSTGINFFKAIYGLIRFFFKFSHINHNNFYFMLNCLIYNANNNYL